MRGKKICLPTRYSLGCPKCAAICRSPGRPPDTVCLSPIRCTSANKREEGGKKKIGERRVGKKIELRVKRSPDLCPASRSIGGASPKVRRQVSTLICCRREWEGKKYEKQFVHSRRSIRTIWITRMSAIETRRDEIGGRGRVVPSIERSPCKVVVTRV